jgi:Cu-processing system permease protein
MLRILNFVLLDILKNKIVLVYTLLLSALAWSTFALEDSSAKGILTMLNILLLTIPLVAILFSTIYLYNSAEFIELLLSQPIQRRTIWTSQFLGLSISLSFGFLIGAGIPILIFATPDVGLTMVLIGVFLTVIFVSIAMLSSILSRDKAKGIGISVLLWLYFSILFDGILLFIIFQFAEYPIEKLVLFLSALSPVDISRILILLKLDVSALMGYTGAVFKQTFGNSYGFLISFGILSFWALIPFLISLRMFNKKDL